MTCKENSATFLFYLLTLELKQNLRANVNMYQTNSGKSPKFVFSLTFMHCSPTCPNNFGVVFLWKYILVFKKWYFSFDRSNMQIFTLNITRVVWPHVTNLLDLWYFWRYNPLYYLFYHNSLTLLKLEKKCLFFSEYFCPTYFFYVEK